MTKWPQVKVSPPATIQEAGKSTTTFVKCATKALNRSLLPRGIFVNFTNDQSIQRDTATNRTTVFLLFFQ
jgi:hypothetical protein